MYVKKKILYRIRQETSKSRRGSPSPPCRDRLGSPSAGGEPVEQQVDGGFRHRRVATARPPRRVVLAGLAARRVRCSDPSALGAAVLGSQLRRVGAAALQAALQARGDLAEPEADRVPRRRRRHRGSHGVLFSLLAPLAS